MVLELLTMCSNRKSQLVCLEFSGLAQNIQNTVSMFSLIPALIPGVEMVGIYPIGMSVGNAKCPGKEGGGGRS